MQVYFKEISANASSIMASMDRQLLNNVMSLVLEMRTNGVVDSQPTYYLLEVLGLQPNYGIVLAVFR
jgi:hypothetical protein